MELTRFGHFILQQTLSAGGLAEVFIASDPLGKTVVLRRLNSKFKYNLFKRFEFRRGIAIHARMHHPYVCQLHEVGSCQWLPYATIEHHEGVNFRQAIMHRHEFLSDPLPVFGKLLESLAYVHSQRLMHMDFKPENILLTHGSEPKLFDFDLSRPIPRKPTVIPHLSGTPAYLSPEQILKEPVDERSDIFALGITAYEVFTGQKPFVGQNSTEIFRVYTGFNTPLPPPTKVNPLLSPTLSAILMRCVEKRVERRYPSIKMIIKDLGEVRTAFGS